MALAARSAVITVLASALCPSCPTNLEARARVLSDGLLEHAWSVGLPFAVVGVLVHQLVRRLDRSRW